MLLLEPKCFPELLGCTLTCCPTILACSLDFNKNLTILYSRVKK